MPAAILDREAPHLGRTNTRRTGMSEYNELLEMAERARSGNVVELPRRAFPSPGWRWVPVGLCPLSTGRGPSERPEVETRQRF
jgi:hypothetical protein